MDLFVKSKEGDGICIQPWVTLLVGILVGISVGWSIGYWMAVI